MKHHSVGELANLAGVSVRTLRFYDRIDLLKPSVRTRSRYRKYGEEELLRLQQILFYKELDFSLNEIKTILNNPGFDVIKALESHRIALINKTKRMEQLIVTIDKTITSLRENTMLTYEELYDGLPKEKAEAWRNEAIEKWGEDSVQRSEASLKGMSRQELNAIKSGFSATWKRLASMRGTSPESPAVQGEVARHYEYIRRFWGRDPEAEAYKGLGQLYLEDGRYTMADGKPDPEFAWFLSLAMDHFADTQLE